MKKLKTLVSVFLCLTVVLSSSGTAFATSKSDIKLEYTKLQQQKENTLNVVEQQLKEQNAEQFYPIYEQMINDMYENNNTKAFTKAQSKRRAYFPDGGVIYYSNYLGTKVQMTNTYLSQKDCERVTAGKSIRQKFIEWVSVAAIGLANESIGIMLGFNIFVQDEILAKQIEEAGGVYFCVTKDASANANIALPWGTHPYASYYSDATVIAR